jgi:lysophospholipase L1-like esterase
MKIQSNSKLVMIGDSITDCGRARPVGEVVNEGLGNGYVSLINALLTATYGEQNLRIINMGNSGDTVRDLKARWQADVLDLQPDWLSIMIGINDVWRHYSIGLQKEKQVSIDEYQFILEQLIINTMARLKGLVLFTPYFLEPNIEEPMRKMMDSYGKVVHQLAQKYSAVLVHTQAAFDRVIKNVHALALAADRVHPNLDGHMVIARAFLEAVGFEW